MTEKEMQEKTEDEMEGFFLGTGQGQFVKAQGEKIYQQHLMTYKLAYLQGFLTHSEKTMKNSMFSKIDIALMIMMLFSTLYQTFVIADQETMITELTEEIKTLKEEK